MPLIPAMPVTPVMPDVPHVLFPRPAVGEPVTCPFCAATWTADWLQYARTYAQEQYARTPTQERTEG